jgi:hypothetical protein
MIQQPRRSFSLHLSPEQYQNSVYVCALPLFILFVVQNAVVLGCDLRAVKGVMLVGDNADDVRAAAIMRLGRCYLWNRIICFFLTRKQMPITRAESACSRALACVKHRAMLHSQFKFFTDMGTTTAAFINP